jgi:diamine N-acetyltransferase
MSAHQAMQWTIREAAETDVDALSLIGSATFLETFSGVISGEAIISHCLKVHSADAYRNILSKGGTAWLAEVEPGAAPIGFAVMSQPDLPQSTAGDIELKRIYVLSRFHGNGPGKALMNEVVQAASSYRRILLGVYSANIKAQTFYRKHGFEEIGGRRFDVGGTLYDDIVMAKFL